MSKPVYTVQVDSRFRDLEKYPNTTDFGVSFRKRTSTTPFVEGLPVNNNAASVNPLDGSNFYVPTSIDPDFDNDLFQILNGKITNMKAIDENNVVLCGLFTGNELSFYQNDTNTNIQFSPSDLIISLPNNNLSCFIIKFSRFENAWTFNWAVFAKQPDEYIALEDKNINCSFDIDNDNTTISFMFNFSCPKIYIQSLTSLSVQTYNQYITLYEAYHPDNTTKTDTFPYALNNCLIYSLFDYNGNIKYVDNHPWGYNIISSNHNLIQSEINCKFNIKLDNSIAQIVSANTNNFEAVLSLTGYGTGFTTNIFPNSEAYGITYTYSGINYVINLISDPVTNETNVVTQEYTGGELYQINTQCLTGLTSAGITSNNLVNVAYLEKNNNIYFHISPLNIFLSNPTGLIPPFPFYIPTYESYIYTYDKTTKTIIYTTTGAGDFNGSRLGFPGGKMFDSTSINPSNLTGAYIIGPNSSVYGTTGSKMDIYYWDETITPPVKINSYDFSPSRKTILSLTGLYGYDLFALGYYSSIIHDGSDVYYVCSPAPISTGTMTGDGLIFDNITSIYKINSLSITGTAISNTLETQSFFYPQFYLQNSDLNIISAAPDSQILNVNKSTLQTIQKSKFNGGNFSLFLKEYNSNLYAIFNSYFNNKVFQINDPENPLLISGKQQFPVFGKYEVGQILFVDDDGWSYGFLINQNTDISYFFSCPFLTKPAEIKSSHYNQNISAVLNPINFYGQPVSTYSIDYLYKPSDSLVTNSFGFDPLTQLVNSNGDSILYSWYDASKTGSVIISGTGFTNKVEEVIDLSNNNRNLFPFTGMTGPLFTETANDVVYNYGFSLLYKGGMDLRTTISNTGAKYMAVAWSIKPFNGDIVKSANVSGFYDNSDNKLYNILSQYSGFDPKTYTENFAGSGSNSSAEVPVLSSVTSINKNIADFQYYNDEGGIYDFSFRGTPFNVVDDIININFTGSYLRIGDNYLKDLFEEVVDYFRGEIYEVIVTTEIPSETQRQKIISYLGKKWNMNSFVPDNNPYKQYESERLYSTLLTQGSTGYANIDLYDITNLQNIIKINVVPTTIDEPSFITCFTLNNKLNAESNAISNWIFSLGKSSLEIYTNVYGNEFTDYVLFHKINYTSVYENQCWKVLVYSKLDIIIFIVVFINGYAIKYKINKDGIVQELNSVKFELPPNGFLTSAEINLYEDGNIYFFGLVGITDVNFTQLSLQNYQGKIYFCDITNDYDFIKIESNINKLLGNIALTNRNSTKVIKHPNGNTYLYLRSIYINATQFINITDYTVFTYNNYNKIEIVNSNSYSFETPINISTQISFEDGNLGCFCPADIYINPSNNNVISIQTQNNNFVGDYITPQDQQFYLGFINCNYITNDPEGVFPIYPFGTRVTQLKAGIIGNKVYAGMLLTDISNSFAATGVYFSDISNPSFSYTYFKDQSGSFPLPLTSTYNNREGISIGFINKCDYQGIPEWLNSVGGSYSGVFSQFSNISNMTLDHEKRYIYLCGGWNSKVECFDSNNEVSNSITFEGTSYNGFCTKIDIIDGSFKWLTPILGNNDDFTEKISFNNIKNDVSFIINFSSNNMFLYEPQYSFTGSSGYFSNPKVIKTVLLNTSSLTSSIITLDTEGNYKWKVILSTSDPEKSINSSDIYIDDSSINIVGKNNCSIMQCKQSDNTDVQLMYNFSTNSSLYIYRFDLDGKYIQSNLIKYPNNINVYVNDIKAFKNINQVLIFPYIEVIDTKISEQIIYKYNKDGSIAKTNLVSANTFINIDSNIIGNTGSNWFKDENFNIGIYYPDKEQIKSLQFYDNKTFIARQVYYVLDSSFDGVLYDFDGITNTPAIHFQNNSNTFEINVMKVLGNNLYIGGNIEIANNKSVNNIFYVNTGGTYLESDYINTLKRGLNGVVYDIEEFQNNIYIGGSFTGSVGLGPFSENITDVSSQNIILYNTGSDSFIGISTGLNGVVRALATDGNYLYVGGDFTGADNQVLNHVAYYDGTGWGSLASGLNGRVNTLFYKNSNLYAGGEFTSTNEGETGSTLLNYIARWDGYQWNSMDYGLSNTVNIITDYTGQYIAIGGDFTNSFTGSSLNYVTIWDTTGWIGLSTGLNNRVSVMAYTGPSSLYVPETLVSLENNKYTQVNFYKYISSYYDLNGNEYSYLSLTYEEYEKYYKSETSPSDVNALTNYNAFIQGPKFERTKISETKQTLIADNTILNKNYSIRGNFFTGSSNFFSGESENTFKIILNSVIDISKIDRINLPFLDQEKWSAMITKSPLGDSLLYEATGPKQYVSNGILPITITNIYGQTINTYSNLSETTTPYYVYYYSSSSTGNIQYIQVNSVNYNSTQKIYYLSLQMDNYDILKYFSPFTSPQYLFIPNLFLSKKNLSAEYTLQFYPATLNSSKVFNLSLNNLIIPNRPIRNTTLEGTRLLTDLPYIYLSVFNADDNGLYYGQTGPFFGRQEINNFFSNNVTRDANAIFEIPMKYAVEQENFIVLSSTTKPRIKFTPNYYNIRYIITDPDGNVLLFDNTPYKSIDNFAVVPDNLLQTNVSLNFEPLTN